MLELVPDARALGDKLVEVRVADKELPVDLAIRIIPQRVQMLRSADPDDRLDIGRHTA
jgi:hypothetical protein